MPLVIRLRGPIGESAEDFHFALRRPPPLAFESADPASADHDSSPLTWVTHRCGSASVGEARTSRIAHYDSLVRSSTQRCINISRYTLKAPAPIRRPARKYDRRARKSADAASAELVRPPGPPAGVSNCFPLHVSYGGLTIVSATYISTFHLKQNK